MSHASAIVALVALTCGLAPAQTKGRNDKKPVLVGPKRTVTVERFDVRLISSSSPTVQVGGGYNNTSVNGSGSDGTITVQNTADFGVGLSSAMTTALTESRAFSVIVMGEAPDPNNPAPAQEAQAEAPIKPQYVLRATVTEIACRKRSGGLSIGILSGGQGQYENKVTVDVRLIDPSTNVVAESVKATGRKTSKDSMFGATKYAGGSNFISGPTKILDLTFADFQESPLAEACRLAVEDAVNKLIEKASKRPWESTVIRVVPEDAGPELYLDVERDCGLKVGDRLELCVLGEELTDPKTNRVVGRARPKILGKVEVFMTDSDRIICRPIEGLTSTPELITAGLMVRLLGPAK